MVFILYCTVCELVICIINVAVSPVGRQAGAVVIRREAADSLRLTWGRADRHRAGAEAAWLSQSSSAPLRPEQDPGAEHRWIHTAPAPPPCCPPVSTERTTPTPHKKEIKLLLERYILPKNSTRGAASPSRRTFHSNLDAETWKGSLDIVFLKLLHVHFLVEIIASFKLF